MAHDDREQYGGAGLLTIRPSLRFPMRCFISIVVFLLVAPSLVRAADPASTPTREELEDIQHEVKQLSVYVYSAPELVKACEALGQFGPKARSAIPVLVAVIDSPDHKSYKVRVAAVAAIADIGGPAATKSLAGLIKHNDVEVRRIAVRAVAAADSRDYAERLRAALPDDDPEVWAVAALGLLRRATGEEKDGLMRTLSDRLAKVKLAQLPGLIQAVAEQAPTLWAGKPSPAALDVAKRLLRHGQEKPEAIAAHTLWCSEARCELAFQLLQLPTVPAELHEDIEAAVIARISVLTRQDVVGLEPALNELGRAGVNLEAIFARLRGLNASWEKFEEGFLARAEKVGVGDRELLARAYVSGRLSNRDTRRAAPEVATIAIGLNDENPLTRAMTAAFFATVDKKDTAEAVKRLKGCLDDKSPLVAAVVREVISRLEK